jgi:signal transduction histidine kinase/response regulator RpfG family c-di-GMP phosphodiesterase
MSMRIKAALIIAAIIFGFTAANYISNFSFTRRSILVAMEQDLAFARDIANDLVSSNILLLKADASTVAERLLKADSTEKMTEIIEAQINEFPAFISLTVYDRKGIVANSGEPISYDVFLAEKRYMQVAFEGEGILSTTHYNSNSGSFNIYVFVPMGQDMVLSATIPGMTFSDLLAGYRLWQTGSIFMLDSEGVIIANYRENLVLGRRNLIEEGKEDADYRSIGNFFQKMLENDKGSGTYYLDGVERLCAFSDVSNSKAGWHIAVTSPLNESPASKVQRDMLFSSLLFLCVGLNIAVFVSGFAAKPFYKIEAQNRSLAELNETVRAASEAKSQFLARMSHEMRTPLNAIIGLSELSLESSGLNEVTNSNLEKIFNAGSMLLSTVNDILDVSKIESGKFELVPMKYYMPSLINDTVVQSIMHIGDKPIEFVLDIQESLPAHLYGDELRVKQMLNNLLSNAFKYTRKGRVELGLRSVKEDDKVLMTAWIRDTGIGIRPEDIGKLFTDYTQMDTKYNREITGTGLGLTICKMIAELMEGSVGVESEYGVGSVFTVKFRQKFVSEVMIGPEVVKNLKSFRYSDSKRFRDLRMARISMPYARVLVVDDILTNLDVAKGMLKLYGMQIDCLTSGYQAVEAIREEKVRYNAIFMDHMMPGMDGIEAVRMIREEIGSEYAKTVPIIALTANAIVSNEKMFLDSGFQAFLSKPIDIARLDAIIRQWVRDKELEKEFLNGENGLQLGKTGGVRHFLWRVEGIDLQKGFESFGCDEELFLQVLHSFALNTPPLLQALKDVNKSNLANYGIVVHGIKGSCRAISADQTAAQAEALEKAATAGDIGFVSAHNPILLDSAEKLLAGLQEMLDRIAATAPKPKKDQPEQEVLQKLLAACTEYDMDGVDEAMAEIEAFEYECDGGLAAWLRDNVEHMNFKQIIERLMRASPASEE